MDIQLTDVTIHVDKNVDAEERASIEETLRGIDGVVSVRNADNTSHLFLVTYNPEKTNSHDLLNAVTADYGRAELVGA